MAPGVQVRARRTMPHKDTHALVKGVYANYFEVGETPFEVVIDFGQRYSDSASRCHTRIVTSPVYAAALLRTLRDALERHHSQNGEVPRRLRDMSKRSSR